MSKSQSEKAPNILPEFDDLALLLKSIPGVDEVPGICDGAELARGDGAGDSIRFCISRDFFQTLFIILSSSTGAAIGKKVLDIAGDMVAEYFKRKKLEKPPKSVVIFDEHGNEIRRVELKDKG